MLDPVKVAAAAEAHALKILGQEQFDNNEEARDSIINDFTEGADWAAQEAGV